jgi:uncharacterized membrane protein YhfC
MHLIYNSQAKKVHLEFNQNIMNILYITYPLNVILIFAAAIGAGYLISKKFKLNWLLFWIGGAVFILSQVFHVPFNMFGLPALARSGILPELGVFPIPENPLSLPARALVLGLSAGIFEETARLLMYRFWIKDARSWGKGLMVGAGHGGMEAIIIAIIVLYTFFQLVALKGADLSLFFTPEQLPLAEQQVAFYWSVDWYISLASSWERIFTLPVHIALSVMVLQVFLRRQARWLFLAIAMHTMFNAVAVYSLATWGVVIAEGLIALMGLASVGIIFALRTPEPAGESTPDLIPAIEPTPFSPPTLEESEENLSDSRYSGN